MAVPDPTQHGLKLIMKDHSYEEDGLVIWSEIENWVCTYVNYYYPNPSLIINDRVTSLVF
jgi:lipoxygenase